MRFAAEAEGPKGRYTAGHSSEIKTHEQIKRMYEDHYILVDAEHTRLHFDNLINRLIREGWEPLPQRGGEWFSHRFRRRVK